MAKAEETQIRRWFENGGAGGVAQLVKVHALQVQGPKFNPQDPSFFFLRPCVAIYTPRGSLTIQFSLLGELQTSVTLSQNKKSMMLLLVFLLLY